MTETVIPNNLYECFAALHSDLSKQDIVAITKMTETELCRLHHGLGRWIRNNWGLWTEGPLKDYFNQLGLHHPDDMSGVIILSYWRHLRGEPLQLEEQIKEYQDFWKKSENQ